MGNALTPLFCAALFAANAKLADAAIKPVRINFEVFCFIGIEGG